MKKLGKKVCISWMPDFGWKAGGRVSVFRNVTKISESNGRLWIESTIHDQGTSYNTSDIMVYKVTPETEVSDCF